MARPLRIEFADAVYHVTSRGLEQRDIVRDDRDRERWLSLLGRVATRRQWRVYAWALMSNHCHVFLRTPHADLSAGMHDLNSGYANVFNRRHGRVGPLLQGRYKAVLVERAAHEWELSRYVHLNPVRAGLASEPAVYRWSSCRWFFRARQAPEWLAWEEVLGQHGRTLRAARRRYREYLDDGLAAPPRSPFERVVASTLLGSPDFVARMKRWLADRLPDRDVPAARELRPRATLDEIERAVCDEFRVSRGDLRARGRHGNEARRAAICLARELTALTLRDIGARLGGIGGAAVANLIRRTAGARGWQRRLGNVRRRLGQ